MKKLIALKFLFLLGTLLILPTLKPTFASTIIFQDNFDNVIESQNKWVISGPQLFNGDGSAANWKFENGMYGISINNRGSQFNETIPKNWDPTNKDYSFEVDMKLVRGADINLVFRYQNHNNWYGIHGINSEDRLVFQKAGTFWSSIPNEKRYHFTPNTFYHFKIDVIGERMKVSINGEELWDVTDPGTILSYGTPGLQASTGGVISTEVWFDNVVVTSIEPPSTDLSVPLIKQTDEPWHLQTYDTADLWSPSDPTIHAWGCALTSAAMVLKYHGINKLPDGTDLDPGTLNTWLKNQPDGYVGKGFLNWLSISRLSKLATAVNGITTFDALEYFRKQGEDKLLLTEDLNNLRPDILEEPGHFIVAKGINGDTFNINDPAYNRLTLNDDYSNTFLSLGRYIPSGTDLSYILLVTDENLEIALKDSNGNPVGEQFIQQPITNYNNPSQTNGPPLKMFYLPKPQSGNYQLILTSSENKTYKLNSYLYDQDGNVNILNIQGIIGPNQPENLTINFDNQNSNNSGSIKTPTFQNTIEDIKEGQRLRLIQSDIAKTLIDLLKMAQKDAGKGRKKVALMELKAAETLLNKAYKSSRGMLIKAELYQILIYDIQYLKTHL